MTDSQRHVAANEDPVCGMTVDVERARISGLTHQHDHRAYVFCGKGCMLEFREDPTRYLDSRHLPMM